MKILILGKNGMLGSDLVKFFPKSIKFGREDLDITKREEVIKKITKLKPQVVINATAFTKVDEAETNKEQAYKVNVEGVKNLLDAVKKNKSILIHFSTDYVFDGKKKKYKENDKKNPLNFYGKTKAEAEDYIINSYDKYYIIRTAWLFGKKRKNFVDFVLDQKDKKEIKIVYDKFSSPTYTVDLAKKIKELIDQKFGIYHITNKGYCSWKQWAQEILKIKKIDIKIKGIKFKQLKLPAIRPKKCILINTKLKDLRPWQEALREYLKK